MRRLGTRLKEHKDACVKYETEKSAISDHAWTHRHPINWEKTSILDNARSVSELRIKEALHINMETGNFNRDKGIELYLVAGLQSSDTTSIS